jgi:hypothetical protein
MSASKMPTSKMLSTKMSSSKMWTCKMSKNWQCQLLTPPWQLIVEVRSG